MANKQSIKSRLERLEEEQEKESTSITVIREVIRADGTIERTERIIEILKDCSALPENFVYEKDFVIE